jgi:hypothetical protein
MFFVEKYEIQIFLPRFVSPTILKDTHDLRKNSAKAVKPVGESK